MSEERRDLVVGRIIDLGSCGRQVGNGLPIDLAGAEVAADEAPRLPPTPVEWEAAQQRIRDLEERTCCKWEADTQRRHLEALGLAEEFEWGCDAIEKVGEALLAARRARDDARAEVERWKEAEAAVAAAQVTLSDGWEAECQSLRQQLAQERAGAVALRAALERVGGCCDPGSGAAVKVVRALATDAGRAWLEAAQAIVREADEVWPELDGDGEFYALLQAIERIRPLVGAGPEAPQLSNYHLRAAAAARATLVELPEEPAGDDPTWPENGDSTERAEG